MAVEWGSKRKARNDRPDNERYTPLWLKQQIASFLGADYLDPCQALDGNALHANGLELAWRGAVFCNPPYSHLQPWIVKAMTEPVREIILLLPAYTDTRWFQPLFSHSICFVKGRIAYDRMRTRRGGIQEPMLAPHPSVIVYRGRRHAAFARHFADLGPIMRQYHPRRAPQPSLWEAEAVS